MHTWPQTEEIGLDDRQNFQKKFTAVPVHIFTGVPPNFHTSFYLCKWSPRHSNDLSDRSGDPNMFTPISSMQYMSNSAATQQRLLVHVTLSSNVTM